MCLPDFFHKLLPLWSAFTTCSIYVTSVHQLQYNTRRNPTPNEGLSLQVIDSKESLMLKNENSSFELFLLFYIFYNSLKTKRIKFLTFYRFVLDCLLSMRKLTTADLDKAYITISTTLCFTRGYCSSERVTCYRVITRTHRKEDDFIIITDICNNHRYSYGADYYPLSEQEIFYLKVTNRI